MTGSNIGKYTGEKEEKNEKHETPVDRKKRTDYKMVKVNNELHNQLKLRSVQRGESMQEIVERAIRNELK